MATASCRYDSSSATYASSSTSATPMSAGSALRPVGREQAEPVEHQRAERVVVLREVVDRGRFGGLRRAHADGLAVEVRRALDLERELDRRELRIEPCRRLVAAAARDETQRVEREVSRRVGLDEQNGRRIVDAGGQRRLLGSRRRRRRDGADALAALDRGRSPPASAPRAASAAGRRDRAGAAGRSAAAAPGRRPRRTRCR